MYNHLSKIFNPHIFSLEINKSMEESKRLLVHPSDDSCKWHAIMGGFIQPWIRLWTTLAKESMHHHLQMLGLSIL